MAKHDLVIFWHPDGITIYRKETHTGQYTHFDSVTTWNHKIAWIRSLISRAKRICSPNKLNAELCNIRRFASYNGFPNRVTHKIIKKVSTEKVKESVSNIVEQQDDILYFSLPYLGQKGENIVHSLKRKLFRYFTKQKKIKLRVQYKTTKVCFFTNTKDRIPLLSNSRFIYKFKCPGCSELYVGKTNRTLYKRTLEHAWEKKDSAVRIHLAECAAYHHILGIFSIDHDDVDLKEFQITVVRENTSIISKSDNWQILDYLEPLYIKELKPTLNTGMKATKRLCLFD